MIEESCRVLLENKICEQICDLQILRYKIRRPLIVRGTRLRVSDTICLFSGSNPQVGCFSAIICWGCWLLFCSQGLQWFRNGQTGLDYHRRLKRSELGNPLEIHQFSSLSRGQQKSEKLLPRLPKSTKIRPWNHQNSEFGQQKCFLQPLLHQNASFKNPNCPDSDSKICKQKPDLETSMTKKHI